MTLTPDIQPPRAGQHNDSTSTAAKLVGGAILWLFAAVTFCVLPLSTMASDGCNEGDTQLICSIGAQQAVVFIPMLTAPTAAALGTWGLCSRRAIAPFAWIAAMLLLMGTWAAVGEITR
ncbi:hypothetical protein [Streptomyces blastmyceticus]